METFLGVPGISIEDVAEGQIVVMSAAHCTPYEPGRPSHSCEAPAAIRAAGAKFAGWHSHHDFDTGRALLPDDHRVVDAGEIETLPDTPEANRAAITAAVRTVLDAGGVPIVFGGDDSVPIPVLQAYEKRGPIWIVQVDAHIDWRDERFGEPLGWSSPMRRASEMGWVEGIVQLGVRGVGSATPDEVEFATAWGAKLITARDLFADGIAAGVAHVPAGARVFVTVDCDGLDPSVMPGVAAPSPGGLTYWQMIDLFAVLGARCSLVGFDIVELAPPRDVNGLSALTAARIACLAIDTAGSTR